MSATIRALSDELMEQVKKVEAFGDRQFSIYNIDELAEVGEGAGYAGGIVSAAVDGLKAAAAITEQHHG